MPDFFETGNYRLDVIAAPGHHRDHVVFHEKNRGWLFTGDLYVSRMQAVAFKDENISDAIDSLTRMLRLDFDTVFCGHSGINKNGKEKIAMKLDNYLRLRGQVNALREQGLGPEDIDKRLFPKKNLWSYVSRGEWSSLNMVRTV
jgi:glyoxylase-like metal-dependent hydrolase (beta-lactamase superfamily II)